MFFRIMDKDRIGDLVTGFAEEHEVVGPVARGNSFVYAPIQDPAELRLDFDTTMLPPKKYFFPAKEELLRFDATDNMAVDDTIEVTKRVIFGVHACDINSFSLMDAVFLGDGYEDPYYKARREATMVVGIGCTPRPECFCKAWGTDEVHQGYDLFLHDLGDRYLVSVRSVTGAEILDRSVETRDVTPADTAEFQRISAENNALHTPAPDTTQLPLLMDALYDDEVWEELGERCLSCGACSMVCPTCHCFDVNDKLDMDGKGGSRERTWDSCLYLNFAAVAHGENFRSSRASRVRQRFYHKLLGYLTKHDRVLCTGCGRCVTACKADINPRVVIDALQGRGE